MIPSPELQSDWKSWGIEIVRRINPFMEEIRSTKFGQGQILQVGSFTVANLPSAATPGRMIYVSDETGGAVVAFSDGTNWRRVTDRAVVS